jgi:hypothetical protein
VRRRLQAGRAGLDVLRDLLTPDAFALSGFTIMKAVDVTDQRCCLPSSGTSSIVSRARFEGLQAKLRTLFRRPALGAWAWPRWRATRCSCSTTRRQLEGMEPYRERSDAPGESTTREVLCHLLEEPGWSPRAALESFAERELPVIVIAPGDTHVTPERRTMTVAELRDALERQRRELFDHLQALSEADLHRKARIPPFKQFMGTDEIPVPMFVGAMFDFPWNDHAGQLAKIRHAVGLPEAG